METQWKSIGFGCASHARSQSKFWFLTSFLFFQHLIPRLDGFDNRGIETQIWTNLCDKYSSTGRWHAIPSCRTEIRRELRGRVHSFSASVIPIRCGMFEFTARTRAPKSGNNEWIWASKFEKNEKVHVIRTGTQRNGFSQGSVRQLAIWFDDILMYWQLKDTEHPSATHHRNLLTAYTAVFLAVIALQQGIKVWHRQRGSMIVRDVCGTESSTCGERVA